MTDGRDEDLEALDLEVGMQAAFDGGGGEISAEQSILARLATDGRRLRPVLLADPDASDVGDTPVVRPGGRKGSARRGRYQIVGEIARGGVGVVLKGHDVDLGRDVAMKVIREEYEESPEIVQRFVEEAQIGGQLQHPGIVPVYEIGLGKDNRPYFTMKLIKGKTFSATLGARTSVKQGRRRALAVFESVCQTMAYAHARGVIHRDLKPSNIMVGAYGEVLIVDWGMGKVLRQGGIDDERAARRNIEQTVVTTLRSKGEGSQSVVGSLMGTPRYMSPEQARGDVERVDKRSDVFGLGAILCEILTGKPPYTGGDDEVFAQAAMARLEDALERLAASGADEDLLGIAKRCLMPAPEGRYQDAGALAKAVSEHLSARDERAEQDKLAAVRAEERAESALSAERAAKRLARKEHEAATAAQRARRLTIALATAAVLVVAAGAGLWLRAQGAAEREREETARVVAKHVKEAEAHLEAGRLTEAAESAARAYERDPTAAAPIVLREKIDVARRTEARVAELAAATEARKEARARLADFDALQQSMTELQERVNEERRTIYLSSSASEADRAAFAQRETDLEMQRVQRQELLVEAGEAVERARRLEEKHDASSEESDAILADIYVNRWRLARIPRGDHLETDDRFDTKGDVALATAYRSAAMLHDKAKVHEKELLGRGRLTVHIEPADAEIHLFRYESLETVVTDRPVIPRLVPVPTSGIGRVEIEDYEPGAHCCQITRITEEGPAAKAGLKAGDLLLTVAGIPCDFRPVVSGVVPDGHAAHAGLKAPVALEKANGREVFHALGVQVMWLFSKVRKETRTLTAGGVQVEAPAGEMLGVNFGSALALLGRQKYSREVVCLSDGSVRRFVLEPDEFLGARFRVTAYPLALSAQNRIRPETPIEVDPGSYLLYVRAPGREPQRYCVVVPRGRDATAEIELLKEGDAPKGFVYVPPGPYIHGDEKAFRGGYRYMRRAEAGYWIRRDHVTFGEYCKFLDDPETRETMRAELEGDPELTRSKFIPVTGKESDAERVPLVKLGEDGTYEVVGMILNATPVLGVGAKAADAFVRWYDKRAQAAGDSWTYDLPNEQEFEKAARGADGRGYPWGPRYDPALCIGKRRAPSTLFWAPASMEIRDESPFGIYGAGGARSDYVVSDNDDGFDVGDGRDLLNKGGSWMDLLAQRPAQRGWIGSEMAGFRLVAHRR